VTFKITLPVKSADDVCSSETKTEISESRKWGNAMRNLKLLSAVATLALYAAVPAAVGLDTARAAGAFAVTSSAFKDNDLLDQKFAGKGGPRKCDGENISPPLQWSNAPEKTKSFAIIIHDDAGEHGLGTDHWIAYGIPASITSLTEGEASKPPYSGNYVGGKNIIGKPLYLGPCPDAGELPHHFQFTVVATDLEPGALDPGLDREVLLKALKGHSLVAASIIGRYARH
jgi:Raf kinase inhibitor-like YbhB/YbcL family protein